MNMFVSTLLLDRKSVRALRITDAYSLHRVVYSLYEDVRDSKQKRGAKTSGILYADQGGDIRGRNILMLANRAPTGAVNGRYGEVRTKRVPSNILSHEQYRFKVIVNPTRRDNTSRKLVAVRGRDNVARWFTERAVSSWGFAVSPRHLQVDKIEVHQFTDKEQRNVTIGQACVQGLLRINDKDQFTKSFTRGIGRARAYGCGLLQIVPFVHDPLV